jgi:hypothetical protein
MFTKSKTALFLVLITATASTAMAAPKHAVRQQAATAHSAAARQVPARAFLSFGSAQTGQGSCWIPARSEWDADDRGLGYWGSCSDKRAVPTK